MSSSLSQEEQASLAEFRARFLSVPVRKPQRICLCDHPEDGHSSSLALKKGCLNCACPGFSPA